MNASALFLLLLLNLILIGRQDRLKRREVARRLRGIIDQIQGETEGQGCRAGNDACNASEPKSSLLSPRQEPLLIGVPLVGIPRALGIKRVSRVPIPLLSGVGRAVEQLRVPRQWPRQAGRLIAAPWACRLTASWETLSLAGGQLRFSLPSLPCLAVLGSRRQEGGPEESEIPARAGVGDREPGA